jgi:hypothetical protein
MLLTSSLAETSAHQIDICKEMLMHSQLRQNL